MTGAYLCHGTRIITNDWGRFVYGMPSIENIRHHSSYLRRLTAVQAYARMALKMVPDVAPIEPRYSLATGP